MKLVVGCCIVRHADRVQQQTQDQCRRLRLAVVVSFHDAR